MGLLTGKTALVTGAARGIGKAIALKFAEEGANIAFTDLVIDENGEATKAEIEAKGVKCMAYASNAADFAQTAEVVGQVHKDFGTIDILVNNAGITNNSNFIDLQPEDYERVINTNLVSMMHMCHLALPYMVDRDTAIVCTASVGGMTGVINQADYCAAKTGVIGLVRALALEFAPRKVRVNAIAPGMIMTDMLRGVNQDELNALAATIPLGRIGDVSDIAGALDYILDATYLTGQTISPNGGFVLQ